jgi:hypothetical protein
MNLLETARKILEVGRYTTAGQFEDSFYFEDETLFGLVWIAPSVDLIMQDWEQRQDRFLVERDRQLRRLKEKSWNAYTVMLCEAEPTEDQNVELYKIEENFRGTRKIIGVGLRAPSQVMRALYPLIQIQNLVRLQDTNAIDRLRRRLSSTQPNILDALLKSESPEDMAKMLLTDHEN